MVRKAGFEPTRADWCALRSDRYIRCSTYTELFPHIFVGDECNHPNRFLSFHPREQGRVSTHSQSESYSYQRPTLLGICILTKPYHTYDLPPPIVKSYCVAPQPVYFDKIIFLYSFETISLSVRVPLSFTNILYHILIYLSSVF